MKYTVVVSEWKDGKGKVIKIEGEGEMGEVMKEVSKWMGKQEVNKISPQWFNNWTDFNDWLGGEHGPKA